MPSAHSSIQSLSPIQYSPSLNVPRAQSQWLFSPAELQRTPSIIDGMNPEQERANRSKGVSFITQVGILLKLPQLTLATASVYLHRFFMRHSMVDLPNKPGLHHYAVAATALFLATKVEENCRKMRELIVACCRIAQKQPNLVVDDQSKEYWRWRDTILHNEDLLLEALCFDLQLEQPYRVLCDFLCYYDVQDNKNLRNISWSWINDAQLTIMCLLFPAPVIAGTALYAAARFTGTKLPDDDHGRPWWDNLGIAISDAVKAVDLMAEVYESSALPRQGLKEVYTKDVGNGPDTTRLMSSSVPALSPSRSPAIGSQGTKRDRDEDEQMWRHYNHDPVSDNSPRHGSAQPTEVPNGAERSPKRQRCNSSSERATHSNAKLVPGPLELPLVEDNRRGAPHDDVQKRIDDIINATSSNSATAQHPHPPLSRRTYQRQQQAYPGPPPRRRSSSTSNRTRPPSRQESYGYDDRPRPHSRNGSGYDYGHNPGYDSHSLSRQSSFNRQDPPPRFSNEYHHHDVLQHLGPHDGNGVHSGSEEGEL